MALTQIDDRGLKTPIDLLDNEKIRLGTGNDLELFHDASNSYIKDTGTGDLNIAGSIVRLQSSSGETLARGVEDGAFELYHDNSKKLETTSAGVDVTGTLTIDAVPGTNINGARPVLYQKSDGVIDGGSNLTYDPGGDVLSINGSHINLNTFRGAGASATYTTANHSSTTGLTITNKIDFKTIDNTAGAFKLVEGSNEIITVDTTDSSELIKFGTAGTTRMTIAGANIDLPDSQKIRFGTGNDLQISHTGSISDIVQTTDTEFQIRHSANNGIQIRTENAYPVLIRTGGEESARFEANGAVKLYHNNVLTFNTESTGIELRGPEGGNCELYMYADEGDDNADLWKFVADVNGGFSVQNKTSGSWENSITAIGNGATDLWYDNSKKLETTNAGVKITCGTHSDYPFRINNSNNGNMLAAFYESSAGDGQHGSLYINANDNTNNIKLNAGGTSFINNDFGLSSTSTTTYNWSSANGFYYYSSRGAVQTATDRNVGWAPYYVNKTNTSNGSDNRLMQFLWSGSNIGSIYYNGTDLLYATASDYRLKENIVNITDGITRLKQLKPRRFNWISDETNTARDGFIAHEVSPVVPGAINGTKDKVVTQEEFDAGTQPEECEVGTPIYQDMDYGKLTPLLTAALQEAITKIETLETKVAALEAA